MPVNLDSLRSFVVALLGVGQYLYVSRLKTVSVVNHTYGSRGSRRSLASLGFRLGVSK